MAGQRTTTGTITAPRVVIAALCAVVSLFAVLGIIRSVYRDYTIKREIARLTAEAEALERTKIESLAFLESVHSADFIEREARSKLGMAAPGEYKVIFASSTNIVYTTDPAASFAGLTNARKWWYYFFAPKQ